jgi:hypothetical protein
MPLELTENDARTSLSAHVAARGADIQEKYGPRIGWSELLLILNDRSCTRYPCEMLFDSAALQPGEFAFPEPKGEAPEDGFTMHVHPLFSLQLDRVPYLVLYQLVLVNYGPFASPDDAEIFGANALGISREDYYQALCQMADQLEGCSKPT